MEVRNKTTPVLYDRKEDCCGCYACESMCPVNAITMKADEIGFEYPVIDEEKCVGCMTCIRVCPIKSHGGKTTA